MKLIDSYFNFASFYKSTGDGLLLTIPFNEGNLKEMAQKTVASCIACHAEFGNICNNDPMIYFKVPDKIGIGIARGTACCLVSKETIIDYSGRLLNLTSRLTDLARPSGIIIDGSFGINLLNENIRENFKEQDVYLDGIFEEEPTQIYFTKEFTKIPKRNTQPIAAKRWQHVIDSKPFRDLLTFPGSFRYPLGSEPRSGDDIKVTVQYPKIVKGRIQKGYFGFHDFDGFEYELRADKPTLLVDFPKLCQKLKRRQVKEYMNVKIDIAYVER